MTSIPVLASLNPLSLEDLATLQDIKAKARQISELIERAKAVGLPIEEAEAKNQIALDTADKIIAKFFPASHVGPKDD